MKRKEKKSVIPELTVQVTILYMVFEHIEPVLESIGKFKDQI